MKKIYIIVIFIFTGTSIFCQESCRERYDMITKLIKKSDSLLYRGKVPLLIYFRIPKSKRKAKEALKLAYKMLEENDCEAYSPISRIIDLELRLGNPSNAEKIAFERLNKMKFNWKDKNTTVPTSYLTDLVRINRFDRKKSFFKVIRRNKGFLSVCGFIGNEQDVTGLLSEAENLFNNYGPIYCLKYLQSSTIFINEDRQYLKPTWEKIYRLLIQSMRTEYEYNEIKTLYESSEIQKIELTERQIRSLYYGIGKSQFYFNLGEIKIFFKTKACPDDRDRNKRCQPKNCKSKKANSDLYKIIKQYAT